MYPDGEALMDTERNLLFGVVAFQNGAVDADRLAETCAAWVDGTNTDRWPTSSSIAG